MPARTSLPPPETLAWVEEAVGPGSRVASVARLRFGGWHSNHRVDVIDRRGARHRLVLRRWTRQAWITEDPDFTVAREVVVLGLLAEAGFAAPITVAADPNAASCDAPALLVTRLPGHPPSAPADLKSYVQELAAAILEVHQIKSLAAQGLAQYRTYEPISPTPPKWLEGSGLWEQAFRQATEPWPEFAPCLIHRDYHPGNTLWLRGHLSGVVDWTQASWGPPGIDVGAMRWSLAWNNGPEAAAAFLRAYEDQAGTRIYDPFWDVLSAVDLVSAIKSPAGIPKDAGFRGLEEHISQALALM